MTFSVHNGWTAWKRGSCWFQPLMLWYNTGEGAYKPFFFITLFNFEFQFTF